MSTWQPIIKVYETCRFLNGHVFKWNRGTPTLVVCSEGNVEARVPPVDRWRHREAHRHGALHQAKGGVILEELAPGTVKQEGLARAPLKLHEAWVRRAAQSLSGP